MTDVVERDLKPWQPASGRRTALAAAALLLALGAVALLIQGGTARRDGGGARRRRPGDRRVVLSRAQREPEAAVAVAWMGAAYAAVAGLMLAPGGRALRAAGGLRRQRRDRRRAHLPGRAGRGPHPDDPARRGGRGLPGDRAVLRAASFVPAEVLTTTLVLVVIVGSVFPWMALGATGTRSTSSSTTPTSPPTPTRSTRWRSRPTRAWPTRSSSPSRPPSDCCSC